MTESNTTTGQADDSEPPAVSATQPIVEASFETALEPAPAMPVQVEPPRGRSARWPVAVALIALIVAVSALVGILVTGGAPNAKVLGYVPDGTIVYGEARLDLPGDQRLALASFLSKFPGFADQAAIEDKLNEVMDRFVSGVTHGDQTYTADIQPWFDGELAFALPALPDPGTLSGGDTVALEHSRTLVLASIKDATKATAWFRNVASTSGATMTDETYNGATLTSVTGQDGSAVEAAFAVVDGRVALFGDVASVKAAIDTHGGGPFANQPSLKTALDATDSSHIGFVYVDVASLVDWATKLSGSAGAAATPGLDFSSGALRALIPDWEGFALRVESDAIVLEMAANRPASSFGPTDNRATRLTDHVPASALVVGAGQDVGATLIHALDLYRSEPSMKSLTDAIEQGLGVVGGADGAVGWIGDAGYVVNQADGVVEGGVVMVPTDQAAAVRTFTGLRTLLALGGAPAGLSITDEPYAGTTITTIDLGDLAALADRAGIPPEMLGTGVTLPSGHVQLAYAVADQVVVIGSGPAFVKHVLDTTPGTSLASTDRYKALASRIGDGTGLVYVDISAIRGLLESALAGAAPSAVSRYQQDVQPFLAPFDALIEASSISGDVAAGKVIVTVK
jgi:hypothetical protein